MYFYEKSKIKNMKTNQSYYIKRAEELIDKEVLNLLTLKEIAKLNILFNKIEINEDKEKIPLPTEKAMIEYVLKHKRSQCLTCINYMSFIQYLRQMAVRFMRCLKLHNVELHKDSIIQECTQYEVNRKIKDFINNIINGK